MKKKHDDQLELFDDQTPSPQSASKHENDNAAGDETENIVLPDPIWQQNNMVGQTLERATSLRESSRRLKWSPGGVFQKPGKDRERKEDK